MNIANHAVLSSVCRLCCCINASPYNLPFKPFFLIFPIVLFDCGDFGPELTPKHKHFSDE